MTSETEFNDFARLTTLSEIPQRETQRWNELEMGTQDLKETLLNSADSKQTRAGTEVS